ncbi:MAG: hypothetical protein IKS20_10210 [Victivallales bacterium]|nr:hypothetical protein [Victivallales bacterium]
MRNIFKSILGVALLVLVSGCATITSTPYSALDGVKLQGTDRKPSEVVFIECMGLYTLWQVPIFSGDIRWDSEKKSIKGGFSLFRDHVSLANLQNAITNYADSRNCDLVDVIYNNTNASYAEASETGLIGALFGSATINVSAVLVPRNNDKEGK